MQPFYGQTAADVGDQTIMNFFWTSFPSQMIDNIINWSAEAMPIKKKAMTEVEFKKLLGVIFALTKAIKIKTYGLQMILFSLHQTLEPGLVQVETGFMTFNIYAFALNLSTWTKMTNDHQ